MSTKAGVAVLIVAAAGCSLATSADRARETSNQPPRQFKGLPLILAEDFDKPCPERWMPTDPAAWKFTKDGDRTVYAMVGKSNYKPAVRSPESISVLKDVYVSDFVLDVWLRSTMKDYPHRDMCVFFGHQDPTHFYYVHFGLKSDDSSNTIHIVNGKPRTPIVKTRTDGTLWTEGYHHVRLVRQVKTGRIEAYFDDMTKPSMTAEDTTFKWGRIGVGSFDDTGNIDRVVLWGRTVRPPLATTRAAEGS